MFVLRFAAAFGVAALCFGAARAASLDGAAVELAGDAAAPADAGAACVKWRGEARFNGSGYRHVVVLESACTKTASCDVSTDVNPTVQTVRVAPGKTEEVVTFFDSPASAFTAKVSCKLQ